MKSFRQQLFLVTLLFSQFCLAVSYDLVLTGGRVIDLASKLDAVRNVGIIGSRIHAVTEVELVGQQTLDVSGLIVSPGFIDTHSHAAMTIDGQKYQARDGVTTALELEAGVFPLQKSVAHLQDNAVINYGASTGYVAARGVAMGDIALGFGARASTDEIDSALSLVEQGLDSGGIGIGLLLDYISEVVSEKELHQVFMLAAKKSMPIFVHMRQPPTAGDTSGFEEVLSLAKETGASIQVCHLGSNALKGIDDFLQLMREARADGVDVSAESYPYTAGSTFIGAAIWDRD